MSDMDKEREIEKNKREAIEAAAKIFKVVTNPSFATQLDADQRHAVCVEKNKGFAQAFPLVLSKIAREFRYNETAFRRFLDKLHRDPGKGMEGVIERQADYAGYLYEETCRANGKHYNNKTRKDIWQTEYQQMYSWMRDIKKQEKKAKNEFEEESKKGLDERRTELLSFLNELDSGEPKQNLEDIMKSDESYLDMIRTASDATPTQVQDPDTEFPDYTGYAEVQQPSQFQPEVVSALQQRTAAAARQTVSDYLNDSNIPGWKNQKKKSNKL